MATEHCPFLCKLICIYSNDVVKLFCPSLFFFFRSFTWTFCVLTLFLFVLSLWPFTLFTSHLLSDFIFSAVSLLFLLIPSFFPSSSFPSFPTLVCDAFWSGVKISGRQVESAIPLLRILGLTPVTFGYLCPLSLSFWLLMSFSFKMGSFLFVQEPGICRTKEGG